MEQNRYLGIYITPDRATVALTGKTGQKIEILQQFCVTIEPAPESQPQQPFTFMQTAQAIASACSEKQLVFSDIAVAIDCKLYRQQKLHSEFQEYRQISQTIRFDAEEALAVDAAQTAIAFEIAGKQLSGSDVSTFAASAAIMSGIIVALQNNKLDPVTIEPDSICFRRIIEEAKRDSIVVAVSQTRCFLIYPPLPDGKAIVRAFLTSPGQNKMALLTREIMMTKASSGAGGLTGAVKVYDVTGKIDYKILTAQTGMAVEALDLSEKITIPQQDDIENLELVIAAGAAAGIGGKTDKVDFRSDFMPYQGTKAALERTVKIAGICLFTLFAALGILMQMQYYKTYKDRSRIDNKFKTDFIIAMPGSTFPKSNEAVRRLKSEINRMKDVRSGLISASGEESIEAKLTYLFEAINSVPKNIDIDVDRIAVTSKTMSITGSTSGGGYLQLFGAIDKNPKLTRGLSNYTPKEGRDNFMLTIELKGKAE